MTNILLAGLLKYPIQTRMFYGVLIAFVAINTVFITREMYWFMALPLAIALLLMFFFALEKLIYVLVFLTPLSFKFEHEALGFTIDMPTEPFYVGVMCLFFLKLFYEQTYDKAILRHPVTIILILQLTWMFVTSVTSELPLVSFKFFFSRLWYVVTFYFVIIQLFRRPDKIRLFLWLFGISLVGIILYITISHGLQGFDRKVGTWVVRPFFNDHTHYSSVIALIAPVFAIMGFYRGYSFPVRMVALVFFCVFIMGIFFSFSRASWLSLILAFAAFWVLVLKVDYKLILAMLVIVIGLGYLYQNEIIMRLEHNRQESSQDVQEHAKSISNISSDASNLERINRWRSAFRLYEERPILGWGPGTYQFVYAPFQSSEDLTIITTNFGDLGNAHSEYLGPLAESGLPGMVFFIILAMMITFRGINNFRYSKNSELRWISLGLTLGFVTYFTHGILNNFLDTDKASVLFWGGAAILVAVDVYHSSKYNKKPTDLSEPSELGE